MAAPTPVVRGPVAGTMLPTGFQSTIAFASNLTLEIYENTITPPAMDGGDPVMTDTMLNQTYITKAPPCLIEFDDMTVVANYDASVYSELQALINVIQAITLEWPDNTTLTFWGHLRRAEPGPLEKRSTTPPQVTLTIVVDNWDPVNCTEAGPVLVAGSGSCNPCTYSTDLVA